MPNTSNFWESPFTKVVLIIWFTCVLLQPIAAQELGFIPLFNGTNLSGWHVKCQPGDTNKTFWTVDRGSILCDSMGRADHNYVWLLTDEEFRDFELRLELR